jgi:hypothetical protein
MMNYSKIKYYSPYDLVNSIKEETQWSPVLTLNFPTMDTMDIVLFEAFLMGNTFKSAAADTTNSVHEEETNERQVLTLEPDSEDKIETDNKKKEIKNTRLPQPE